MTENELGTRIKALSSSAAVDALLSLRGELTEQAGLEGRRALELDPARTLGKLLSETGHAAEKSDDVGAVARSALLLLARDGSPALHALIEQAVLAPSGAESLVTPIELTEAVALLAMVLQAHGTIGYDKEHGFFFEVGKVASKDSLTKSVLSGFMSLLKGYKAG